MLLPSYLTMIGKKEAVEMEDPNRFLIHVYLADIDSCELEDDRILFYVYFLKLTVAQIQFSSVQSLSHV